MFERGDVVIANSYQREKDGESREQGKVYPEFLKNGIHRISTIRDIGYATLVKTDRHPTWLNSKWFRLM